MARARGFSSRDEQDQRNRIGHGPVESSTSGCLIAIRSRHLERVQYDSEPKRAPLSKIATAVTTGRIQHRRLAALAAIAVAVALALLPSVAWAAEGGSDTGAFQRALAHGALVALAASYVFGLATSLTPCVYPMIAITVSVFGAKEAKSRLQGMLLSLTFVLGIVCLFTPMGVVSALTGKGFGSALGNPWIVAAIAIVFMSLSASLFGAFEIALPASLNNRLSSAGGAGYRGAFVLGLMCGLVAAPCVGPFLFGLLGWIPRPLEMSRSAPLRWRSTGSGSARSSSPWALSP